MTEQDAVFIDELLARAEAGSADSTLLKRAAFRLIGDESNAYRAFSAEAAAKRETERTGLSVWHREQVDREYATAVAHRQSVMKEQKR